MRILVGTDLSEASASALAVAKALAQADDEIVLLHVVDPGHEDAARDALDRFDGVRTELLVDAPDSSISSYAETEGVGLIVIAARSTRGESLMSLGTTASRVVAEASVPVIAVRDPEPWLAFARGERPLRVLLGVDDSATCELTIQWLQGLRQRGPTEIVLGAIYYPDDAAAHYGLHAGAYVDRDPEIEKLLERDMLRRFNGGAGVVARPRRGLGRIGDHVCELAQEEKVDVIVVGTSRKSGLGSVSTLVVNDAPQSVVCVPPNAVVATAVAPAIRSTLVATDLSAFANRAVPWAFSLTPDGGDVHILHVVKQDVDIATDRAALLALAPTGTKHVVHAHVIRGDEAAHVIAQTAARLGVDLIAIASHGRSGISRALVGSVADRLLRATHTPVLVLRPSS